MMPGDFHGRVAVVTGVGGAAQVGAAVATHLASLGARVVLVGRESSVHDRAAELESTGAPVMACECDLTDAIATSHMVARIAAWAGPALHVLVCAAGGFAVSRSVADSDPAAWHRQVDINLTTAYVTTRATIPALRLGQGAIVYFASASVLPGGRVAQVAAYAAAKAGVVTLMQAVAQEERASGIRANALAPTAVRTATNEATMGFTTAFVERETVASWVAHLCAPSAAVNGQVIRLG
jgi:NAD(P)-dependent dehydrogenase (short-subunit alcohol dehydrogenase family)